MEASTSHLFSSVTTTLCPTTAGVALDDVQLSWPHEHSCPHMHVGSRHNLSDGRCTVLLRSCRDAMLAATAGDSGLSGTNSVWESSQTIVSLYGGPGVTIWVWGSSQTVVDVVLSRG